MADTNHAGNIPVEGDGVSYAGIGWFLVVLVATVVFCQVFVWGYFRTMTYYRSPDAVRAPLAGPVAEPRIEGGRIVRGAAEAPGPALLVDEPVGLRTFRDEEALQLHTYGWVTQGAVVRLTIERAKELLLERGLPTREPMAPAEPVAEALAEPAPEPVPAEAH